VTAVDHAAHEVLEVVVEADPLHDRREALRQKRQKPPDDPERETDDAAGEEGDELVVGPARSQHAEREHRAALEEQREITGEHRSPVEVTERRHADRICQRAREQHREQAERRQILAHDDLGVFHRHGQQDLDRARALLFREQAHRERGRGRQQQDDHQVVHVADRGSVHEEEWVPKEETHQQQEQTDHDVRGRAVEVRAKLALRDGQRALHDDDDSNDIRRFVNGARTTPRPWCWWVASRSNRW
jgi:hypothetical protein